MAASERTLLIRHLPAELDDNEKIDLLTHFGAKKIKLMGLKGPMKHSAFALFETPNSAEKCLKLLHQMDVLGCKLVVEYAKSEFETELDITASPKRTESKRKNEPEEVKPIKEIKFEKQIDEDDVFRKHGIQYPRKSNLCYLYPPPTVSTLTNIANALASHPRFYTQVLHLMNKMNLPCPFGTVTASPPLALDLIGNRNNTHNIDMRGEDIDEVEMEQSSTEESEIESDTEPKNYIADTVQKLAEKHVKKIRKRPSKMMRLVEPDVSMVTKPSINVKASEVFENPESLKQSQIVFNLSATDAKEQETVNTSSVESSGITVVEGGFGKVVPQIKPEETEEILKDDVNYKIDSKTFLNKDKIAAGKLKPAQMKEFSVFRKYSAGEPTSRLYIKNLTKQCTEQDIVDLFGSYIDWSNDMAHNVFDIRLMKEGRMKGQAFVTLPDEDCAKEIVKECTGYVMHGKPIVIQFARSAKAKEVKELIK